MARAKILVFLAFIAIGAFFFWQKSSFFNKGEEGKPSTQTEEQSRTDNYGYDPQELIADAKDTISQIEKDSTKRVSDFIEEQKKEIAKQLTGNQESEVKVTPKDSTDASQSNQKAIIVDFAKENNLLLNIKRGEKIYLSFKNTKAGYCLYLNDTKYNIVEGQLLELEFLSAGTFSVKTNLCDLNYSEQGKIIVE